MELSITINKRTVTDALVWAAWCLVLFINLSLTVGSYWELEPKAGKMFGLVTVIWAVLAVFIWMWRRNSHRALQKGHSLSS
ncbi:hypothetical protein [Desulfobaculum bizertense]|uniref:Uncharacterized protein n=1 Tax=Desulfobaculum bizertense DSM 18034 TaxID=1121442 RepID=A0A1T4VRL5_9BACT|nr:hypothetical protein [Desulfobaculum bizertense]SKA67495.1 hypothetical protein SAMN02745702_00835 [Desulfobaculum bizertense DSM 18034]